MRGSRKFCQRGGGPTQADNVFSFFFCFLFFLVDEGRYDPNTTISGSSSARQRNDIKWRFAGVPLMNIECWLGSFMIFQRILTKIAQKPYYIFFYIFVIFKVGPDPLPPPPPPWNRAVRRDANTTILHMLELNVLAFICIIND